MRNGRDGEKMENVKKKLLKIMMFIVATNVVASRPPECRPTGTLHARANSRLFMLDLEREGQLPYYPFLVPATPFWGKRERERFIDD